MRCIFFENVLGFFFFKRAKRSKYLCLGSFLSSSVKLRTGRVSYEIARRRFASCVIRRRDSASPGLRSEVLISRRAQSRRLSDKLRFSAGIHGRETSAQLGAISSPGRSQHPSSTRALRLYRAERHISGGRRRERERAREREGEYDHSKTAGFSRKNRP